MDEGGEGAGTAAGQLHAKQHRTQLSLSAALQEAQQTKLSTKRELTLICCTHCTCKQRERVGPKLVLVSVHL